MFGKAGCLLHFWSCYICKLPATEAILGCHCHRFCVFSMAPLCQRCWLHRPRKRVRCINCWRAVGPGCWPNKCLLTELVTLSKTRYGLCSDWPFCGEGRGQSLPASMRTMLECTAPCMGEELATTGGELARGKNLQDACLNLLKHNGALTVFKLVVAHVVVSPYAQHMPNEVQVIRVDSPSPKPGPLRFLKDEGVDTVRQSLRLGPESLEECWKFVS